MLSHAMPYTLIFGLGAGTWPKASEPQARAGELAPGLPPRPRALRLRARCQTKKTKKNKKNEKTKVEIELLGWAPPPPSQSIN